MTPNHLPEDVNAWPEDPFDLLGVAKGAAEDDIRRAYTRLVRRYKPEHFPEQFRKLRDAFETCRYQTHWYREEPVEEPKSSSHPTELPAWSPPVDAPPDEVERLWHKAIAGDAAAAYAGLVALSSVESRADLPLRLYWLLALESGLDDDRTRQEWLMDALDRSRLSGSAVELYSRELELDPITGLTEPYRDLLDTKAESTDLMAIARLRIAAAGRAQRLSIMLSDLERIKPRVGIDGELGWLSLVVGAAEWAAWENDASLRGFCRDELRSLKHLELQQSWFFDRMEEAQSWSVEAPTVARAGLPTEFLQVVQAWWCTYGTVTPADLRSAVAPLVQSPRHYLTRLDELSDRRGPAFAALARMTLERFRQHSDAEYPAGLLRGQTRSLFAGKSDDTSVRKKVLDWLRRDGIHPMEFVEACADDPEPRFRRLAHRVRDDVNLHVLCLAKQIYDGF